MQFLAFVPVKFWYHCVCSVVDFGPGWYNLSDAFGAQRKYNAPGKSPPLCAEF